VVKNVDHVKTRNPIEEELLEGNVLLEKDVNEILAYIFHNKNHIGNHNLLQYKMGESPIDPVVIILKRIRVDAKKV
jgi:hypothetical protein